MALSIIDQEYYKHYARAVVQQFKPLTRDQFVALVTKITLL
jgi:hypothetical protein